MRQLEKQFNVVKASWLGGGELGFSAGSAIEFLLVGKLHLLGLSFLHLHHKKVVSTFPSLCHLSWRIAAAWPGHCRVQLSSFSSSSHFLISSPEKGEGAVLNDFFKNTCQCWPDFFVRLYLCCTLYFNISFYWEPVTWKRLC